MMIVLVVITAGWCIGVMAAWAFVRVAKMADEAMDEMP